MPTQLVIDSSVVVKWLSQKDEGYLDQANQIIQDVQSGAVTLLAPELLKYEVANALLLGKRLSQSDASTPLSTLFTLPIQFVPQSETLANETYKIAQQSGITYYDASFMALAMQENATLVTDNPKHQGKTAKIQVTPLKDY